MRYHVLCVQDDLSTNVLEAYVKLLINEKHIDLVAAYVAVLPRGLQVQWYATFLEGESQVFVDA